MIALDVDSGAMSVGRFPIYCKRRCNLFASAEYYLIDTSRRFTGTIQLQYQVNLEQKDTVQKVAKIMALICLFKKCSELNKNTSSESSYFCGSTIGSIGRVSNMKTILKLSFVIGLFVFVCGVTHGQQVNPNNLPPCPKNVSVTYHNCFGKIGTSSGDNYIGDFKNDKYHGSGIYTFMNGDKYSGDFKDGNFNGSGILVYSNGDTYVGEFKDGAYNGLGRTTNANGDTFIGEFKDGRRQGHGIVNKGKDAEIEGVFENDQLVRKARAIRSKSSTQNFLSIYSKGNYYIKINSGQILPQSIYFSFELEDNGECDLGNIGCAKDIEFFSIKTNIGYQINHFDPILHDHCVIDLELLNSKLKVTYRSGTCHTGYGNRFVLDRLNGTYSRK